MAVPKRRLSKCRRDRRRANWKLEAPGYVACPQCHEPKMPHRVCPTCGHYKGEPLFRSFLYAFKIYTHIFICFVINSKCHYFIVRLFYKMVTHFYFL